MKTQAALFAVLGGAAAHDLSKIEHSWGYMSTYADNADDFFGVQYTGLPDGCQVESVHTLQRHAQRFPDTFDGKTTHGFADRLGNATSKDFTGPLEFLKTYTYIMDNTGLLTGIGAATEFARGVDFWNNYGRTLFNVTGKTLAYDPVFAGNGSARPKVTLRTTGQSRIENSQINWALGFFGPSFNITPEPSLSGWNKPFDVTIIPEGGTENNTLASYDSCFNDNNDTVNALAYTLEDQYKAIYLRGAAKRLQRHAPKGFNFTTDDAYAMQMICAYEVGFIGHSDFCNLFTEAEWNGFENIQDLGYYYLYAFGNPTGRAQGIGYVQELLARFAGKSISSSDSSVNSTLDGSSDTFPLNQKVYADFSHDDIIISVLTALSMDYFLAPPPVKVFPAPKDRHFWLGHLTPFGANLITEVIGCSSKNPEAVANPRVAYTPGQFGYDASKASNKFVRMRLNRGILPLHTIRGGACGNATSARLDGLCAMDSFVKSQEKAYELSNYDYACFGDYTLANFTGPVAFDGTIVKGKNYTTVADSN